MQKSEKKRLRNSNSQQPRQSKKIMPREFELMPDFLDQIGKNTPDLNLNLA